MTELKNNKSYYAHLKGYDTSIVENQHILKDHLVSVGNICYNFGTKFGVGDISKVSGVLHDLGKYRGGFQEYIIDMSNNNSSGINWNKKSNEKTHSAAGAIYAYEKYKGNAIVSRTLQHVIAGHHSGLKDWKELFNRRESNDAKLEYRQSIKNADQEILDVPEIDEKFTERNIPFLIRMVFSCLVDADSLDTEAFMNPFSANIRKKEYNNIPDLYKKLRIHLNKFDASRSGLSDPTVAECRNTIRKSCERYAATAPGFFSLETPTGGGKTLSSILFGLKHAKKYNKDRIIYAIPFTSIIEQTSRIFKEIFDDKDFHNVVEHHSQYSSNIHDDGKAVDFSKLKRIEMSTENWDAPIIVTTNVQFFESLFASKRSACRKLHNIANSVIIFDEAQQIPIQYLQPFIKALKILVEEYNVTVVFCTATQPNLDSKKDYRNKFFVFDGIDNMTDIIKKPEKLFSKMKRTNVRMLGNSFNPVPLMFVAEHIALQENNCSLTIVSTKDQAQELYDSVVKKCGYDGVYHLSNRMCGVHKMQVINHIKERLRIRRETGNNEPIRVISTTLIEAGVDIDFPVVFKAISGIDSIAQAAGRCNREGHLDNGNVWVFIPEGWEKFSAVKSFADDAISVIKENKDLDIIDLENVKDYFQQLKRRFGKCDSENVFPLMLNQSNNQYEFETISNKVKIIKNSGKTVIVNFDEKSSEMIKQLEESGVDYKLMRNLQGYIINVLQNSFVVMQNNGLVKEAFPGSDIYTLSDRAYSQQKGLVF